MNYYNYKVCFLLLNALAFSSCKVEEVKSFEYKTENVILVVMDGARYSETWGDNTHQYIPNLVQLSSLGIVNKNFNNEGKTLTVPGHVAMTTGVYQKINNGGTEYPENPSVFQFWLAAKPEDSTKAWIISSKDKLEVLSDCQDIEWSGKFRPSYDCGVNGLGTGYRHDSITFNKVMEILPTYLPKLVLINFREPDSSGHSGNWDNYLSGIKSTDFYIKQIWDFLESNEYYKGKTTLIITNDHGRHLDNVANGFSSHGDDCLGCQHINFIALGPDFKSGTEVDIERGLIDISRTIAELLDFDFPISEGLIMQELFK